MVRSKWILIIVLILQGCAGAMVDRNEMMEFAKVTGQADNDMEEKMAQLEEKVANQASKADLLETKIAALTSSLNTKAVQLSSIYFPMGKSKVEDLSEEEFASLIDNVERIREEKPLRIMIFAWADGMGNKDKKDIAALARGNSVRDYYLATLKGVVIPEITVVKRIATTSGVLWRRVETDIWVALD